MPFAFFSLGATTDAEDYLQNFNLLEAKVNPARHSYRVYNHAIHKQVYKLTWLIPVFPVFKANQLFSIENIVLYNLMLNMKLFTYVIKISSKILRFPYPFVDISLQDWSPLSVDVAFSRDTFHSNLRKTGGFPLTPGALKWNKEKPKTGIRRNRL